MTGYVTAVVAQAAGLTERQVLYLARKGLVSPSVKAGRSGSPALWSYADALRLAVVAEVRAHYGNELVVSRLARFVDALDGVAGEPLTGRRLLADRHGAWLADGDLGSYDDQGGLFSLPLAPVERNLRRSLQRARQPVPDRIGA